MKILVLRLALGCSPSPRPPAHRATARRAGRPSRCASSCRSRPAARPTSSPASWRRSCRPQLGQQFVIDNRSGASGGFGTEAVARALPDGYTIGLATTSTHGVAASLNPNLTYNPLTDFAPVSMIGGSPYVLVVFPRRAGDERRRADRARQGRSRAPSTMRRPGRRALRTSPARCSRPMAGVELTDVPYRSSSQAVLDVTERPHRDAVRHAGADPAAYPRRQAARTRDQRRRAASIRSPTCRPSPRPACPATRRCCGWRW